MDTTVNEVIFGDGDVEIQLPYDFPEEHKGVLFQLLDSNYYLNSGLCVDKFLGEDNTIDLEKLELALILLVEYLEKSDKNGKPIYINLRDMQDYFDARKVKPDNLERVYEESTFILGFCGAVVDEIKTKEVIVMFEELS